MDKSLEPGTLVVGRMPSPHQPWTHPIYVGVIEEPGGQEPPPEGGGL